MSLSMLLPEELVILELSAREKNTAIKELAQKMVDANRINSLESYLKAVLKREKECTTGIGFGVGIPHGKSDAVKQPSLAFGRSKEGVIYDSMDGKPVHLLFLIAVPENSTNEHLKILSQLSRKLMHQEIRERLIQAKTPEEIYSILDE